MQKRDKRRHLVSRIDPKQMKKNPDGSYLGEDDIIRRSDDYGRSGGR